MNGGRSLPTWLPPLALGALTFAAYLPALNGGYVWDDDAYVTANRTLRSAAGLRQIWLEPGATPQYYPLVFTTFWIEYRLWGLDPLGYHVVNVLLHAGTSILLWRILTHLSLPAAWVAAALFALHPVQGESVAWITERKNVLSGSFYMAAALLYLRHTSVPVASTYALALACFVAALLSKTVTCSLPAALLLMAWWRRGSVTWIDMRPLLPFFGFGLALAAVTVWLEQTHVGAAGADWSLTFLDRCLIAGRALWFYAATLVWPVSLTFIYPRWTIDSGASWQYLFPLAALAVLAALILLAPRIGRGPVVAVAFFAGTLLPALGFFDVFPMRYSFVADHFQYLACIGPLVLAAAGVARWSARRDHRVGPVLALLAVAICSVLTFRRGFAYADAETLWRDTLARNPAAWMAHNNLGLILFQRGDHPGALAHFRAALAINPDDAFAHNNVGTVLARDGDLEAAGAAFRTATRLEPSNAEAHANLGNVYAARGEWNEAVAELSEAIRLKPAYADAHSNLGNVLALQGHIAEAMAHYRAAIAADPDFAAPHHNLGVLLSQTGKIEEAMQQWRTALALNPNGADSHLSLAIVLSQDGRNGEAIRHLETALRIQPDNASARARLDALRAAKP